MAQTAEYMRQYRATHPRYAQRNKDRNNARNRALEALGRKFPAEFLELYEAELKRLGINGELRSGRRPRDPASRPRDPAIE